MEVRIGFASICKTGQGRLLSAVFVLVLLAIAPTNIFGNPLHESVSVIFDGTKVSLPAGRSLHLCDSTTILSPDVLRILDSYHEVYINRAFDDNDSDFVIVQGRDGIIVELPTLRGVYVLTFEDSASAGRASDELMQSEDILSANQNGMIRTCGVTPIDPKFPLQWSLENEGQAGGLVDADIDASGAWEYETGNQFVKIAIFDTGVNGSHHDLAGRVTGDPPGVQDPRDWEYHGTFVAGIVGARTNNDDNSGVAGINWLSPMISKNIFIVDWNGTYDKIVAAVNEGADILNNSWDVTGTSTLPPQLGKAFAYAYNMDRLSIAASGNDTLFDPIHYPSDLAKLVSVGATDRNDDPCDFSNWGFQIDITAPGEDIWSTLSPGSQYADSWGTSFATPHVSGVASLLKSCVPELWSDDIRHLMQIGAKDLGTFGWDALYGHGRLNALDAFRLLEFPASLDNSRIAQGSAYVHSISSFYFSKIYGVPGLSDGLYKVRVYEVRHNVTFDRPYYVPPHVWGRGAASAYSGYVYQPAVPIFNFKDCDVVPGSITTTGCTLSSHVY